MISKEEVKKLANLARLQFKEEDLEEMSSKLGAILDYVGQINTALTDGDIVVDHKTYNIAREDVLTNKSGEYTDALLKSAPESQDGFVKVKKII